MSAIDVEKNEWIDNKSRKWWVDNSIKMKQSHKKHFI